MATEYSEKLKDPRWQRKRLEILQRDDFTCFSCKAKDKTLIVHHLFYNDFYQPWEYPEESLVTLCEDCHKEEHKSRREFDGFLVNSLKNNRFLHWDVLRITTALSEIAMVDNPETIAAALAVGLPDENIMKIIVNYYLMTKKYQQ